VQGPGMLEDGSLVSLLANTRAVGVSVRADARYRLTGPERGFEQARLTVEKALDSRSDLRAEVEYDARRNLTIFQAGYVRQFDKLALNASANLDSKGGFGAGLAVNFSFSPDPFNPGLRFSNAKLARRGQAAVTVFLDENGDGIRSPDEPFLPGVGITAGQFGASDPTNAAGQAVVEGLSPYERVLIGIDESTLPDPFLVPVGKGTVITPRPGVAAQLQFAVAPTGEVEGTLHGIEGTPRPGVELELVDAQGKVAASTLTEYDGFFLFDRVAYGKYRLRLGASSARALGTAQDLGETATLGPGQTLVQFGVLHLQASTIASLDGAPPLGSSP
jgi:hypothetical protein